MKLDVRRTSARALLRLRITEGSHPSDDLITVAAWGRANTPRSLLTADVGFELAIRDTSVGIRRN
jgi:hypothetical protein